MQDLDHRHLILHATLLAPPRTPAALNAWMEAVVEAAGMRMLIAPHSVRCDTPGNVGVTGTCAIETSHLAAHCWEDAPAPLLKADLYSCKGFDTTRVLETLDAFEVVSVRYSIIDRNGPDRIVASGMLHQRSVLTLMDEAQQAHYREARRLARSARTPAQRAACDEHLRLLRLYSTDDVDAEGGDTLFPALEDARAYAEAKGLQFDLNEHWYINALYPACARWTKMLGKGAGDDFWNAAIDRLDPSKGYTPENCRIVPLALKRAKSGLTPEQVAVLSRMLSEDVAGQDHTKIL